MPAILNSLSFNFALKISFKKRIIQRAIYEHHQIPNRHEVRKIEWLHFLKTIELVEMLFLFITFILFSSSAYYLLKFIQILSLKHFLLQFLSQIIIIFPYFMSQYGRSGNKKTSQSRVTVDILQFELSIFMFGDFVLE